MLVITQFSKKIYNSQIFTHILLVKAKSKDLELRPLYKSVVEKNTALTALVSKFIRKFAIVQGVSAVCTLVFLN